MVNQARVHLKNKPGRWKLKEIVLKITREIFLRIVYSQEFFIAISIKNNACKMVARDTS